MSKICKQCGAPFKRPHKERPFCSRACFYTFRRKPYIAKVCPVCKKTFESPPSCPTRQERKYCSKKCSGKAHQLRITKICEQCGKQFSRRPKFRRRRFCSYACSKEAAQEAARNSNQHKDWRPRYGANWKGQRHAVCKRDGYTCQVCRKKPRNRLQCHHVVPFKAFGIKRYEEANDLSNLISLCLSCHRLVHYHKITCPAPCLTS